MKERGTQDNQVPFDPLDVSRVRFQVGGLAWQLYRARNIDPNKYGVSASSGMFGAPFIRGCLVQDFGALNEMELLCWD